MPIYALNDRAPKLPDAGSFWVAPDAHVIGDVEVGADVGIWFGAVLRGDNDPIRIGHGTNVQDGAMLHADPGFPLTIGAGVTVGHHAILHGCTIGPNTLVGMGATVLNGAVIGGNCIIGANALVPEGREFPANSLIVGVPAKVVRSLAPGQEEDLRRSASGYARNWRRFAAGLRRLD